MNAPARRLLAASAATVTTAALVLSVASCSSDGSGGSDRAPTTGSVAATASTTAAGPVAATVPPVAAGVKDCGTQNDLAGWPTTMVSSAGDYSCIIGALAARTLAQMSSITASGGESGRTTEDGDDLPTRRIVTWVVTGEGRVEETIDRTEDGGSVTTRTCAAFTEPGFGIPPSGTDCS